MAVPVAREFVIAIVAADKSCANFEIATAQVLLRSLYLSYSPPAVRPLSYRYPYLFSLEEKMRS